MKKIYTILALLVLTCTMILCGCNSPKLDMADTNALTIGNGGIAVVKGDYLYYINGYEDASTFTDYKTDNVEGNVVRGAIYRTTLKNGELQKDEDGFLKETEVVVSKVVGFSTGGFYIIGDYLYYVSPLMELSYPEKELQNDLMEICRIKLDGTGNERLTKTATKNTEFNWTCYNVDGVTYVVYLDGKDLISVNANNKNSTTMATNVSEVALLKQNNYTHNVDSLSDAEKNIYYTRTVDENDNNQNAKNVFAYTTIGTQDETILYSSSTEKIDIVANAAGFVYYNKSTYIGETEGKSLLYKMALNGGIEEKMSNGEYSSVYILDKENNANGYGAIVIDSLNNIYRLTNGADDASSKILLGKFSSITGLGVNNGYFYFVDGTAVCRINIYQNSPEKQVLTDDTLTYYVSTKSLIDFDGRRLFVFAQYTVEPEDEESENTESNYYLNVIDLSKENFESKFCGKFAEGECPNEPEECEHEDHLAEDCDQEPWIN